MKWLIRGLLGLVVLIVAAVVVAPMLISKEGLNETAETQASAALGRTVDIGSVTQVSVFPPRLTLEQLTVANVDGFDGAYLLDVEKAQLAVKLMPLFSGRVEIEAFQLDAPKINLQAKADGANNFTLGAPSSESAQVSSDTASAGGSAKAAVVGTILINNGSLSYADPAGGYKAENVDVSLVLPPLGESLKLDLEMALEGIPTTAELTVDDPWRVTETNSVKADLRIDAGGNTISGQMEAVTSPLTLTGPVALKLSNLASLEPLIGAEGVAAAEPLGGITIDGRAEFNGDQAGFRAATYETDIAKGSGDFVLALNGQRPKLTGTLAAEMVDLRPFMPETEDAGSTTSDEGFPPWSEDEIDLSGLRGVDANLDISAATVILSTYELTDVKATVIANAGLITLDLSDARAFDGKALGNVRVDARQSLASVTTDFTFGGVDFAKAAPALLGTDRLTGIGGLTIDLTTRGNSQATWVSNLDGDVAIDMSGGSILGIDLNAIATSGLELVDGLRSGQGLTASLGPTFSTLTTNAVAEDAKTLFDLADMNISLKDGVSNFGTAQLKSDTFRATFGGGANLPKQRVNMSILLAAKAPEASGYRELQAPVTIGGTFSQPKISVDTSPIVKELTRGAAKDALGKVGIDVEEGQSVGDTLKDKARSELLGLFGSRKKKDDQEEDDPDNP